jgi:AIR synthase-related protein
MSALALDTLVAATRAHVTATHKQDIQCVAEVLRAAGGNTVVPNGDDTAVIADAGGYLLIAAEGMIPSFVQRDPWFAGFCSVLVNVSDVAAMGGRPLAVVDVILGGDAAEVRQVLEGMAAASVKFQVPVVGGHTGRSTGGTLLAVSIVGRARRLITSFDARPGQDLLLAVDLRGRYGSDAPYFDAATTSAPEPLRAAYSILPDLAEAGWVSAGKDVSMAGLLGTLVMLCECSGCGAEVGLDQIPIPAGVGWERWLTTFPSFGFLLTTDPAFTPLVRNRFAAAHIPCATIGSVRSGSEVRVRGAQAPFWDWRRERLTGFGPGSEVAGGTR